MAETTRLGTRECILGLRMVEKYLSDLFIFCRSDVNRSILLQFCVYLIHCSALRLPVISVLDGHSMLTFDHIKIKHNEDYIRVIFCSNMLLRCDTVSKYI